MTLNALDRHELYHALDVFDEAVIEGTKLTHLTAFQAVALRDKIAMTRLIDPAKSVESILLSDGGHQRGVG